jgi:hypothetical protein
MNESKVVTCAACGGRRLTPATKTEVGGARQPEVKFRKPSGGWLGNEPVYYARLARICRDCGHVMSFICADQLRKLDAEVDLYTPHQG